MESGNLSCFESGPSAAATTRRGILLLSTAHASLGEVEVCFVKATHCCVRALLSQRIELPAAEATLGAHAVDAGCGGC